MIYVSSLYKVRNKLRFAIFIDDMKQTMVISYL